MRIAFIEDTLLHGGTQIWVTEAIRYCLAHGEKVTLLSPEGSWVARQVQDTKATVAGYDWDGVVQQGNGDKKIWTEALRDCDVAVSTVHPPRDGFHCVGFVAACIAEAELHTHLIAKTGTVVPSYKREFYLPKEEINSSVITIAEFTRHYLVEEYGIPAEKVALIYQGVDVGRFQSSPEMRDEALQRYALPEDAEFVLACVGSFEERKGQTVLLEAVAALVQGGRTGIHLMLVGNGPDEAMLRQQVKSMGVSRQVSFFPFTSQPEYVFERADLTILPSIRKEGLPNVLLESMAMATPVIASNFGGIPEAVKYGESGILIPAGDRMALSSAILKLWQNPALRKEMSVYGHCHVRRTFDKKVQFSQFIHYFEEVKSTI
jgi:glycosyltransferase involved in cell wall biosynthesis